MTDLIQKDYALVSEYTFEVRVAHYDKRKKGRFIDYHTIILKRGVDWTRTEEEARKRIYVFFGGANNVYTLVHQKHDFGNGDFIEEGTFFINRNLAQ